MKISSLNDLKKLKVEEVAALDPQRLSIGTELQDCSLIAQTYERAAHSTPSEAAVYTTFNRSLENVKSISSAVALSMAGYLKMPQERSVDSAAQAQQFASDAVPAVAGVSATANVGYQSFNFGDAFQATLGGNSAGRTLLELARDCIPCDLRLVAFLELNPSLDLLATLEGYLFGQLAFLQDLGNLLGNFDIYGDFCDFLNLLSFMCIPDLQRIIALLMALLTLEIPQLDAQIDLLQALIAPLFSPILLSLTSLLDQFNLLVVNPLDCVMDAINAQLATLGFELDPTNPAQQLSNGLSELGAMLAQGKQTIQDKLNFYIEEIQAMLGDLGGGDNAYLSISIRKLKIVRLIGFVVAVIKAITQGHPACSNEGKPAELSELDNFFNTFLSPNAPFNVWIDEQGQLRIDEKDDRLKDVIVSTTGQAEFPNVDNVISFEGNQIVDPSLASKLAAATSALTGPTRAKIPCKLKTSATDADKLNQFIADLNRF